MEARADGKYFTKNEIKHEILLIDNLTHSIDDKGLKFALQFLKNYKMI